MEETRVVLAGGSPLLQAGIAAALAQDSRLRLIAQTRDVREAAARAKQLACDVFVLNADLPHTEAGQVMERLAGSGGTAAGARTRVLVLTENSSREEMLATLRIGVQGYGIHSDLSPEDLCAGVRALARREFWACPTATRYLMATAVEQPAPNETLVARTAPLSDREVEVLLLLARGTAEEHIAGALCLSRNTVKTYLRRIREKLQATSRTEAVSLAVQRGLIPDRRTLVVH